VAVICPDGSEFQRPLTSAYPRDFAIFRGTFGSGYLDKNFLANAAAVAARYKAGKLAGAVIYTVYLPGMVKQQYDFLWKAIGPTIPPWLAGIMIDVEHWGGTGYAISGDHSSEINALYGLHAHRMGSWNSCIAYGNKNDLATIYPRRDKRCRVIVAGYSSKLTFRSVPGAIGQQYTDGSNRWPHPAGLPTSTVPWGYCDHNVFPDFANGAQLRLSLRPTPQPVIVKPVVVPPKPPTVVTPRPTTVGPYVGQRSIVSADKHHALFITNAGRLEVHRDGVTTWHN
jgi:hypothetical protein